MANRTRQHETKPAGVATFISSQETVVEEVASQPVHGGACVVGESAIVQNCSPFDEVVIKPGAHVRDAIVSTGLKTFAAAESVFIVSPMSLESDGDQSWTDRYVQTSHWNC